MTLDEYISRTLQQIVEGVAKAQEAVKNLGGAVNPVGVTTEVVSDHRLIQGGTGRLVESVSFDVALSADSGTETKGGIGVVSGIFALGSQGKSQESTTIMNRIQFSVPLMLPQQSE